MSYIHYGRNIIISIIIKDGVFCKMSGSTER
jgi:hypothetical protein